MAEFVYVDNSNVWIEGKRVAAVKKGVVFNIEDAIRYNVLDHSYRLDFGHLHEFVAGNDPSRIKRAVLFGSKPPPNDTLWEVARRHGFETIIENRNRRGKEKRIDTGIVTMMMEDAYTKANRETDTLTLVAGDGDYVPTFKALMKAGFTVEVVFWGHASKDLKRHCARFVNMNSYLKHLQLVPKK